MLTPKMALILHDCGWRQKSWNWRRVEGWAAALITGRAWTTCVASSIKVSRRLLGSSG